MYINVKDQSRVKETLIKEHGEGMRSRIERGVSQVAGLWTEKDGTADDFAAFCKKHFIADQRELDETFDRLDRVFEGVDGHFNAMLYYLRENIDLDLGQLRPIDTALGEYDPSAHLTDDLFENKIAFVVLLNFPQYSLEEKRKSGPGWSPRQWAFVRMSDIFRSRVPATINQELTKVITAAETYIAEYNIYMENLLDRQNRPLFPKGLRLISHWGLRDELKSHYRQKNGLARQELIYEVMRRIVTQEIPADIINNPKAKWNPFDNTVYNPASVRPVTTEPDSRYRHILDIFHVMQKVDPYFPAYPTYIKRKFELQREMTEAEVESLFVKCLLSAQMKKVAALIRKRLGRSLRPFDIWYDGFRPRGSINESELDRIVSEKYPGADAFADDMQNILVKLGFSADQASFIAPKIIVDPSRGAGHAWGAEMKSERSRLRTRVPKDGMNYKGYNIAIHEFGHNVEQTLSLHKVDYHMIRGVPSSAFSEAFAFIFQSSDLELLGIKNDDPNAVHLNALDRFWGTCEIMGVALVDMKVWRWLYKYPEAGTADLKKAVIDISREIWNKHFAEIFGSRDEVILAIYSHMVGYPLYLAEYPIGHIIEFQVKEYIEGKKLGAEMERVCSAGNIIPQLWMKNAVDSDISVAPMLEAINKAIEVIA